MKHKNNREAARLCFFYLIIAIIELLIVVEIPAIIGSRILFFSSFVWFCNFQNQSLQRWILFLPRLAVKQQIKNRGRGRQNDLKIFRGTPDGFPHGFGLLNVRMLWKMSTGFRAIWTDIGSFGRYPAQCVQYSESSPASLVWKLPNLGKTWPVMSLNHSGLVKYARSPRSCDSYLVPVDTCW